MKIVVTGGSGFIAQQLALSLLQQGHHVHATLRRDSKIKSLYEHNNLIYRFVDYSDTNQLVNLFQGADSIIHLAGLAHNQKLIDNCDFEAFHNANVLTTLNIVEAAQLAHIKRFIFISSAGVVSGVEELSNMPSYQEHNLTPLNVYTYSKLIAEMTIACTLKNTAIHYAIIRPPLVYGYSCPGNLARLVNLFKYFPINAFSCLNDKRTFISIDNLVSAISSALNSLSFISGRTFMVGDQLPISIAEIAELCYSKKSISIKLPIPRSFLSFIFLIFGQKKLWHKLTAGFIIDSSEFMYATQWKPHDSSLFKVII